MSLDFIFGQRANELVYLLPVLEEEHGGDALNGILGRGHRVLVHIQFGNLDSAGIFGSQLVEHGRNHAAWTAPRRPTVHQNGSSKGQDFISKCPVRHLDGMVVKRGHRQGRFTFPAYRPVSQSMNRNTVLYTATCASYNGRLYVHKNPRSNRVTTRRPGR